MGVPGVGQGTHTVAGASRRMQVDEGQAAAGQGEAIGHADHRALVQAEDVAEILGEVLEERQLVGAGVAEDGGQAVATEDLVRRGMDGFHAGLQARFLDLRYCCSRSIINQIDTLSIKIELVYMSPIDLNLIRTFVTLYEAGSVTLAAERCSSPSHR